MKPGDVWSYNVGGVPGFMRCMMSVRALGLPITHPLAFNGGSWLVQISRATELAHAFHPDNLFFNGCYMLRPGTLKRVGFESSGALPVRLEELEFPWFLADHSDEGYFLCRGELTQRIDIDQATFARWNVLLTLSWPRGLMAELERHRQDHGLHANVPFIRKAPGDIRNSRDKDEIVQKLALDLDESYMDAVRREIGPERVWFYQETLLPRRGRSAKDARVQG